MPFKPFTKLHLIVLLICIPVSRSMAQTKNEQLHQLFDKYNDATLRMAPVNATAYGDPRFNDILPNDISVPWLQEIHAYLTRYRDSLHTFDRQTLNTSDRISYDVLDELLRHRLALEQFHLEYMPLGQLESMPLLFAQMGSGQSFQPFRTTKDYEDWNKRMIAFSAWLDTAIVNLQQGMRVGMMLPRTLAEKQIIQLHPLTLTDPDSCIFYKPLNNMPGTISGSDKKRINREYRKTINSILAPAYQRLVTFLETTYIPATNNAAGVNVYPSGKAYYEEMVRFYTSDHYTPEAIYQLGLSEVDRITKAMEAIKTQTGFQGSLQAFFHFLRTDPQFMPYKTPEEVLTAFNNINDKIQPHIAELFSLTPKARFEIRRSLSFMEASMAVPSYMPPSQNGRPGLLYVPVPDATKINVTFYGQEATFLHEAIPGHHFQIALQIENQQLPLFRRFPSFSAYLEGWALYCESLGDLLGCYTDPYQKMGALNNEIHRAIRLVTDVAIHTGRMTKEEAINYMLSHESVDTATATKETERYMTNPGQALSYMAGSITIQKLRDKYSRQQGNNFSLRKFHEALLREGDMPLSVLEKYMDEWAATIQ